MFQDGALFSSLTLRVVAGIGDLSSDQNRLRIEGILAKAEVASEGLASAPESFSGVAGTVDRLAEQINRFNTTLDTLTNSLTGVLATADETLQSITVLVTQSTVPVDNGTMALGTVQEVVTTAERYVAEDLTQRATTPRTTGQTATARLTEAQVLFEQANTLMAALEEPAGTLSCVATRIEGLVETDAAPLLAETRVAVTEATRVIQPVSALTETELPATFASIQAAVENARVVIADVGETLTTAADGVGGVITSAEVTLTQVTTTFSDANETLTAINSAPAVGERTLSAAERTFEGADRFLNEDISGLITELQTTVQGLNTAIGQVSADLPEISANLRAAGRSASDTFRRCRNLSRRPRRGCRRRRRPPCPPILAPPRKRAS